MHRLVFNDRWPLFSSNHKMFDFMDSTASKIDCLCFVTWARLLQFSTQQRISHDSLQIMPSHLNVSFFSDFLPRFFRQRFLTSPIRATLPDNLKHLRFCEYIKFWSRAFRVILRIALLCLMSMCLVKCSWLNTYQIFAGIGFLSSWKALWALISQTYTLLYGVTPLYTRWFKYDRDWFVCKQAAPRSSCATLREWSHNLHPPSCSG